MLEALSSVPHRGKCPVVTVTLTGKVEHITPSVYPWAQGTPEPSQQPSLLVFKLCAFDHLLGLKIFYANSSQAPEVKDRRADIFLASGTPSGLGWEKTGRSGSRPLSLGLCHPQRLP